jgi:hypothetical protein
VSCSHDKTTKAKNNDALQDCFLFASWVKRTKNESYLKEYAHPVVEPTAGRAAVPNTEVRSKKQGHIGR